MQHRYLVSKEMQKTQGNSLQQIRMTQAQLGMDSEIHRKYIEQHAPPSVDSFKLKRFVNGVDPKVSTKRGSQPFMSK